jgi:hypothetical protein
MKGIRKDSGDLPRYLLRFINVLKARIEILLQARAIEHGLFHSDLIELQEVSGYE